MAFLRRFSWLWAVPWMVGCTANMTNTADVFTAVRGVIEVNVSVPESEGVTRVQFQLNNEVVAEDENGQDGYTADIDTSGLESGTLAKISAVGVRADGSVIVLRENLILVGASTN